MKLRTLATLSLKDSSNIPHKLIALVDEESLGLYYRLYSSIGELPNEALGGQCNLPNKLIDFCDQTIDIIGLELENSCFGIHGISPNITNRDFDEQIATRLLAKSTDEVQETVVIGGWEVVLKTGRDKHLTIDAKCLDNSDVETKLLPTSNKSKASLYVTKKNEPEKLP